MNVNRGLRAILNVNRGLRAILNVNRGLRAILNVQHGLRAVCTVRRSRHREAEHRAPTFRAVASQFAAMRLDDGPAYRKPDAQPSGFVVVNG